MPYSYYRSEQKGEEHMKNWIVVVEILKIVLEELSRKKKY
jgi:hypothetical protein